MKNISVTPVVHNTVALLARMRKCSMGEIVSEAVALSMTDFEAQVIADMMKHADYNDDMASQRMPQ
jgi:hypothetical protein